MHQNSLNKTKKQLLSTNYSTIMRPIGCFWRFAPYFSSSRVAGTAFSRLILRKTDRLFAFPASSRDVFGRSEEGRFTLHGGSAYTPRRIGLRSTENRSTLHVVSAHAPRSIFEENRRRGQVPHSEAVERAAWFTRRRASFAELRSAGRCREKFGV